MAPVTENCRVSRAETLWVSPYRPANARPHTWSPCPKEAECPEPGRRPFRPCRNGPAGRPCSVRPDCHRVELNVGPAEVVHPADLGGIAARRHHGRRTLLIDGAGGHVVGVDGRIHGNQKPGKNQARLERSTGWITAASEGHPARADQRLDHRSALHFVVVLTAIHSLNSDFGRASSPASGRIELSGWASTGSVMPRKPAAASGPRTPTGEIRRSEIQIDIGAGVTVIGDVQFPRVGVRPITVLSTSCGRTGP
jgi:hypothetical protein